jgi:hypothetical protein
LLKFHLIIRPEPFTLDPPLEGGPIHLEEGVRLQLLVRRQDPVHRVVEYRVRLEAQLVARLRADVGDVELELVGRTSGTVKRRRDVEPEKIVMLRLNKLERFSLLKSSLIVSVCHLSRALIQLARACNL